MKSSKLTIGTRLLLAFSLMIGLIIGIAAFGTAQLSSLNGVVETLAIAPELETSRNWGVAVLKAGQHMRGVFLADDAEELKEELEGLRECEENTRELAAEAKKSLEDGEETEAFEAVVKAQGEYDAIVDQVIKLVEAGQKDAAQELMEAKSESGAEPKYIDALNKLIAHQIEEAAEQGEVAKDTYERGRGVFLGFSAVAAILAGLISWFLTRGMSRELTTAIQHMQSSSTELQSSAAQQASTTKEQASAASEVSTTLKELVATARQIGESAQRVAQLAEDSRTEAKTGEHTGNRAQDAVTATKRQVDLIVHHMLDLGKKSQEIGGVLDIVNELSEQTNILSINATIEASGAGDAGLRFSAVAEEIRKLADRTAASTKEIRMLVEEIRAGVNTTVMVTEGGSKAADAAAKQISDVVAAFGRIGDTVVVTAQAGQEIELSTRQQTTAVEQATQAVVGVAQTAREADVSMTQTLQTAAQLTALAKDLTRLVRTEVTH
ncbi:MAG TPA: methyl-accepting chemotaxis protein [Polyangiales bacterium]|nr:methyl-accepting chemotaxis protein [Polyangiales bacterium]